MVRFLSLQKQGLELTANRDVAAGIAILEEAGGLVTTANSPDDLTKGIPAARLGSRLYLAIRYANSLCFPLSAYTNIDLDHAGLQMVKLL